MSASPLAPAEVIPRSVLLCAFEGVPYLLAGLGDGQLFTFIVDEASGELGDRKQLSLGTQPITLRTFRNKTTTHVFAAGPATRCSPRHKMALNSRDQGSECVG